MKNEAKNKKILKGGTNGITLIALIITIIVLLILAAISIATLTGDNGVLTKAGDSKEENRGGAVQEARNLWKLNKDADGYTSSGTAESLAELLEKLGPNGQKLLTAQEIAEINETGKVKIGSKTIVFGATIGEEYDNGNIKIGDKLTYSAGPTGNVESDWIVFGKDKAGNVLLTTSAPVGSFTPTWTKEHWFTWESELDEACKDYSGTIQGKEIKARSIRIEDINKVTGFTEPEWKTYRFGTTQDYANGKVNYYYPDKETSTFVQASSDELTVSEGTPARDIESNAYQYYVSGDEYKFYYNKDGTWTTETIDLTKNLKNVGNMKYVIGETGSYMQYYVASRAVDVNSGSAIFNGAYVYDGNVDRRSGLFCNTYSLGVYDAGGPPAWGVRPIVELPSDIQVKITGGAYDIR